MEILALLLLGLITMLAIVPPLIRGRLDASPLTSTLNFQRSMQEMGSSLEPQAHEENISRKRAAGSRQRPAGNLWTGTPIQPPRGRHSRPISRAEIRRRRFLVILTFSTIVSGIAALAMWGLWFFIIFGVVAFLSLTYLSLSVFLPKLAPKSSRSVYVDRIVVPPKRQAM
ncbi:MAG: hypothetical protein A2W01_00340 [Candidatus Solincola sediminis]|uniref:Uncharacterized protein n=1 Tax=Candidatus Solincola sediminis TaxID=1797199 RepID=A0A1F2WHN3_9ACTN|nr:MAG: hypothetical protein A2Y75_03995 [Candidatus Solincola sediminis]OFW61717.1 MAG: hypothetical protein A2W01_00340 [Candidatus Solincola sediminis]